MWGTKISAPISYLRSFAFTEYKEKNYIYTLLHLHIRYNLHNGFRRPWLSE